MVHISIKAIKSLGATDVLLKMQYAYYEPLNQESFSTLTITSPVEITFESYLAAYDGFLLADGIEKIRVKRDAALKSSDFVMSYDIATNLENKDEWTSYRKALRAYPATISSIVWNIHKIDIDYDAMGFPVTPSTMRFTNN